MSLSVTRHRDVEIKLGFLCLIEHKCICVIVCKGCLGKSRMAKFWNLEKFGFQTFILKIFGKPKLLSFDVSLDDFWQFFNFDPNKWQGVKKQIFIKNRDNFFFRFQTFSHIWFDEQIIANFRQFRAPVAEIFAFEEIKHFRKIFLNYVSRHISLTTYEKLLWFSVTNRRY